GFFESFFLTTLTFIVLSYAALDAVCASEMSADSKLGLKHVGVFMSPSSVCEATEHPPAHTGMKAQSPQFFHAPIASNRLRAASCHTSCRRSMWPVDCASSPVKPGHA